MAAPIVVLTLNINITWTHTEGKGPKSHFPLIAAFLFILPLLGSSFVLCSNKEYIVLSHPQPPSINIRDQSSSSLCASGWLSPFCSMVSYWSSQSWCFSLAWWFSQQNLLEDRIWAFTLSFPPFLFSSWAFIHFYLMRQHVNFYFEKEFQVFNTIKKRKEIHLCVQILSS